MVGFVVPKEHVESIKNILYKKKHLILKVSMEKRLTLFLFGLILSIGTAIGQTKINGTVFSGQS